MSKTPEETRRPHSPGIEMEYTSLRGEIVQRIGLRQQIVSITLTLAGIFLTIGLTNESVSLIYPPLAMLLAFGWANNDFRISQTARYIRTYLETDESGLAYETLTQQYRQSVKGMGGWRFVVISHGGVFLFTQLMAVGIEALRLTSFDLPPLKWALLAIDVLSIVVVFWLLRQSSRKEKTPS